MNRISSPLTPIAEKIKYLRREIIKTFLLFFLGQFMVLIISTPILIEKPLDGYRLIHFCWFLTYFTIALIVYCISPWIIKRRNKPDEKIKGAATRILVVFDKKDSKYTYTETAWTNDELSFRWKVIKQCETKEEALAIANTLTIKMSLGRPF
jgi:surface polysaccharide O-acyltransferase-like enzyme